MSDTFRQKMEKTLCDSCDDVRHEDKITCKNEGRCQYYSEVADRICEAHKAEVLRLADGMPKPTLLGGDKGLANLIYKLIYMNMLKQYKDDQAFIKGQIR